jgi:xanthine dehydrogenase accessory factor
MKKANNNQSLNLVAMAADIFQQLHQSLIRGERIALVTTLHLQGSGPRRAGSKMLVLATGATIGTIGGGWLEAIAIGSAREVLATGRPQFRTLSLSQEEASESGMICGGTVDLLMESLDGSDPEILGFFAQVAAMIRSHRPGYLVTVVDRSKGTVELSRALTDAQGAWIAGNPSMSDDQLWREKMAGRTQPGLWLEGTRSVFIDPLNPPKTVWIFGAGHVAESLAPLCALVDFRVVVLDDRAEFANIQRFPSATEVRVLPAYVNALDDLPIGVDALVVIVTRGHLWDQVVLAQALRTDAAYIGMIGSRRKRDTIYRALMEEGFGAGDLQRVHCPIGLAIGAETPREISVSIVAELIAVRAGME